MAAWLSLGNSKENTTAMSKQSLPKQHDSERRKICMFSTSSSTAPSSSHLLQSLFFLYVFFLPAMYYVGRN
jgi:hypothetical protein